MHNKHQELIAEKVAEFIMINGIKLTGNYLEGDIISVRSLTSALIETLQDTIDTVLKEEGERVTNLILLRGQQMRELYGSKLPFVCLGNDEEACRMSIYLTAHEDIIKALDKTPPIKV